MGQRFQIIAAVALAACAMANAADVRVQIILPADIRPGLYGRVELGPAPPPPLYLAEPVIVRKVAAPPPPVYLHVPPGHAKNWRKHCHRYNACGQPVYFVKSAEYESGYGKPKKAKKDKDKKEKRD